MKLNIDERFLVETTQQLVRINSINPSLVKDSPGEKEIAFFLENLLTKLNLEVNVQHLGNDRKNVIGMIKGNGKGPSLMLNAHTDTVGVQNMADPFSAEIKDGKLFGRGAFDMKGSIAAMITVAKSIIENNIELKGNLVIAFVADEEYGSIGTEKLLEKYKTDAAIVTEPTELSICTAHNGFGLFEIETSGKAAHGGKPDEGIDANMHMGLILAEINRISQELKAVSPHKLLGLPSMHIPLIKGGNEPFTYADKCKILLERRTIPGESFDEIFKELKRIISTLSESNVNFSATIKNLICRDSFENDKKSKIISVLHNSVKESIGYEPSYIGHSWWEDSGLISNAGIDTVVFGPKGKGLHTENEWVDIQSLKDLSLTLLNTAINYCK